MAASRKPSGDFSFPTVYYFNRLTMRRLLMTSLLLCLRLLESSHGDSNLGDREFALTLYASLRETENSSNLLVSPASVSLGLRLLMMGARGNTLTQLQSLLGYQNTNPQLPDFLSQPQGDMGNSSQGVELQLSSTLLVQSGLQLRPEFTQHALGWGNGTLLRLNFSRTNQSQGDHYGSGADALRWLEGSAGEAGPVALVTALAFRGVWQKQFLSSDTHTLSFSLPDGTHTKVPMMYQATEVNFGQFRLNSEQRYTVLELPYHGHALSLMLALPSDRKTPLWQLEAELSAHTVESWENSLRRTKMDVFLPRFRLLGRLDLRSVLTSLGISDAFDPTAADFRGMSDEEGLYVSEVLHQASMEVTEDGTKAAAATAMMLLKRSRAPVFKADRPFLFLLRHLNTGSILFMGRVLNPAEHPL
ncbi:probable serpin E3 isoform X1 [Alosa sapidissima]|uniref:probable serpin E3 isoform X1 n=2 Tax=Alosa sapidissima TaxID=34773 RepID=UPI001C0874DF|nr:probable serpin E3 isoform X1 [Alosa sapidissima]